MRVRDRSSLAVFVIFFAAITGCARRAGEEGGQRRAASITVKGSDTMVILGQRWAEAYMRNNPAVAIQVTGGGSGTGIAALINGTTDIAQSSRPMKGDEKAQVQKRWGRKAFEIPVALDALAVFVHESNPVQELTLKQIGGVYTGKITNWKQIGGKDSVIVLYGRESNSGTYVYFKEHVLGNEDFAPEVQTLPGTAALINAVSKDPDGIGYGGIAYGRGVKHLKVKKDADSPAYEPTLDNALSGRYPISRFLYFYTIGEPRGETKKFIDWVLSDDGQKLIEAVGYYPLPAKARRG